MAGFSDYHIAISPRDDSFVPKVGAVANLIEYLDGNLLLDGPDRDDSKFIMLAPRDMQHWQEFLRRNGEPVVKPYRRKIVHMVHPPSTAERFFTHYGDLQSIINGIFYDDAGFVASLGRGTRRMTELLDGDNGNGKSWIRYPVAHVLRGFHAVWDKVWDEQHHTRMWELRAAKGFSLLIQIKVQQRTEAPQLEDFVNQLQLKPEFRTLLLSVANILGTEELEIIAGHSS